MTAIAARLGYLPAAVSRMASAPQVLDGFLQLTALVETTTLDPLAREVVALAISTRNGCPITVAMHSPRLTALGGDCELLSALRDERPLPDPRLQVLREFTHALMDTTGAVGPQRLQTFLGQGFTEQNALEIVLLIGVYTLSTLANRLTEAPLDPQLAEFAWTPGFNRG